jgi:hypothetical protein
MKIIERATEEVIAGRKTRALVTLDIMNFLLNKSARPNERNVWVVTTTAAYISALTTAIRKSGLVRTRI